MRLTRLFALLLTVALLTPAVHAEDAYNDIDGVVKLDNGDIVPGATVKLMKRMGTDRDLHEIASVQSDKRGKFHFEKVAIGTFVVDASKSDLHAMRHIDLAKGDANFTITLHEGAGHDVVEGKDDGYTNIDGIVRSADKDPINGAKVRLLGTKKDGKTLKEIDATTTDAKGYFQFYKVADGNFTIEVTSGKHTTTRDITTHSGEHADRLEFTFKN